MLVEEQSLVGLCSDDLHRYLHANVEHTTEDIKMFLGNCKHLVGCKKVVDEIYLKRTKRNPPLGSLLPEIQNLEQM